MMRWLVMSSKAVAKSWTVSRIPSKVTTKLAYCRSNVQDLRNYSPITRASDDSMVRNECRVGAHAKKQPRHGEGVIVDVCGSDLRLEICRGASGEECRRGQSRRFAYFRTKLVPDALAD